ncbi:MAG: hypothetical protein LBK73_06540 [Treponema sp.]|jgi:hypothetical protein|nr:hypothetical protein [Treponema sp.]
MNSNIDKAPRRLGNRALCAIKPLFAAAFWTLAIPLAAQAQERLSFSLSPKVLKDGSIIDMSLGCHYTPQIAGNVRLRFSNATRNERFDETADSLNVVEDQTFALFLTPLEFALFNRPSVQLKVGGGLYYEYHTLAEKGFFNSPKLEEQGKEPVNSFSNDFKTHSVGPTITLGFNYQTEWFSAAVNGGVVPIFYLSVRQNMKITPLMGPPADYSQETAGGPYFYADLSVTLFKYVSLALFYEYAELDCYKVVGFDDQFKWLTPESKTITQSLKLEVCAFIPLGGNVYIQIGYGHSFDSTEIDYAPLVESGADYLILAMKARQ